MSSNRHLIGKLTALINTSIPMTVERAANTTERVDGKSVPLVTITATYFDRENKFQRVRSIPEYLFVGFGDHLVFSGGVFTSAFDDDEPEELDEDEDADADDVEDPDDLDDEDEDELDEDDEDDEDDLQPSRAPEDSDSSAQLAPAQASSVGDPQQ